MNENVIEVINDKGALEKVEILKYFKLKSTGKDYLIYKEFGNKNKEYLIYAAEIIENADNIFLNSIEDKKVLTEIQDIMEEVKNG